MQFAETTVRPHATVGQLGLLFLAGVLLAACAKLPDDGASAVVKHFDGLRAVRYCEVFLIGGDAITKNLKALVYNTTNLNNAANPHDTCPADMWAKVDPETLKKQYDVLGVFKNGPRGWANDWIELPVGAQRDFDGAITDDDIGHRCPRNLQQTVKCSTDAHADVLEVAVGVVTPKPRATPRARRSFHC